LCHLVFYDEEGVAAVAADFIDTMFFDGKLLNDVITNDEFVFLVKQFKNNSLLIFNRENKMRAKTNWLSLQNYMNY